MKITFVLPYAGLQGGTRVVAIYAQKLQERGHEVVVVSTPRTRPTVARQVVNLLRGRQWKPHRHLGSHMDATDVPHVVVDHAPPVIEADVPDADVIIATWWGTVEWLRGFSPRKGAKVFFAQGYVVDHDRGDQVCSVWRMPFYKIVISQWLKRVAEEEYGARELGYVPNSVDTDLFHAAPRGKQALPTIGLLYSASRLKGCDVSLRAIEGASAQLGQIRVVSFGVERPTDDMPLPHDATFVHAPAQHRLWELYASCDVWLCGSRCEGFHLPPLEAMACRCPVVSTRVGGPDDIVRDGESGYVVDIEDHSALARRLCDVLSLSDAAWRRMSDAAYATATRYTWDDATDLFEAALYRAAEREGRRFERPVAARA
jgi:glycosyltransferase involved in cell wall biosynthesis